MTQQLILPPIVASAETTVTDSLGRTWSSVKHPRGKDGKFIRVFHEIRAFLGGDSEPWMTGTVEKINPDGSLRVKINHMPTPYVDAHGKPYIGSEVDVDASTVESVNEKAMLNAPGVPAAGKHPEAAMGVESYDPSLEELTDFASKADLISIAKSPGQTPDKIAGEMAHALELVQDGKQNLIGDNVKYALALWAKSQSGDGLPHSDDEFQQLLEDMGVDPAVVTDTPDGMSGVQWLANMASIGRHPDWSNRSTYHWLKETAPLHSDQGVIREAALVRDDQATTGAHVAWTKTGAVGFVNAKGVKQAYHGPADGLMDALREFDKQDFEHNQHELPKSKPLFDVYANKHIFDDGILDSDWSMAEEGSVVKYVQDSSIINGVLRGKTPGPNSPPDAYDLTPEIQAHIDGIDAMIEKGTVPAGTSLYRGFSIKPEEAPAFVQHLTPGTVIEDQAYMSVSSDPAKAQEIFAEYKKNVPGQLHVLMKIDVDKDSSGLSIDNGPLEHLGENEILLPRGSALQVYKIAYLGNNRYQVEAKYLAPEEESNDVTAPGGAAHGEPGTDAVVDGPGHLPGAWTAPHSSHHPEQGTPGEAGHGPDAGLGDSGGGDAADSLADAEGLDPKKFEVLADPGKSGDGYFPGTKMWGKYGAAGVLIRSKDGMGETRYLVVQRGPIVSSNKGKWQLPGGALDSNENDYNGTAREVQEELGATNEYLASLTSVGEVGFDHPSGWHYTNIAADAPHMFAPHVDGTETGDAKWMTKDELMKLDLHPALAGNIDAILGKFDEAGVTNKMFDKNGNFIPLKTPPDHLDPNDPNAAYKPVVPLDLIHDGPIDASGWKQVGAQGGSNKGGMFQDPSGNNWYVKSGKSPSHAKNEALATSFYKAAGIDHADLQLADTPFGALGTASPEIPGAKQDLSKHLSDPDYMKKIQDGYAVDAWLANWDVAGLVMDNIVTDDEGNPVRVDPGGSLYYRAQGAPKGGAFGDTVNELTSFHDPKNTGSKLFKGMTLQDKQESAKKVLAISPDQIDQMVDAVKFDEHDAVDPEKLKQTLKNRRADLAAQLGLTLPENETPAAHVDEPSTDHHGPETRAPQIGGQPFSEDHSYEMQVPKFKIGDDYEEQQSKIQDIEDEYGLTLTDDDSSNFFFTGTGQQLADWWADNHTGDQPGKDFYDSLELKNDGGEPAAPDVTPGPFPEAVSTPEISKGDWISAHDDPAAESFQVSGVTNDGKGVFVLDHDGTTLLLQAKDVKKVNAPHEDASQGHEIAPWEAANAVDNVATDHGDIDLQDALASIKSKIASGDADGAKQKLSALQGQLGDLMAALNKLNDAVDGVKLGQAPPASHDKPSTGTPESGASGLASIKLPDGFAPIPADATGVYGVKTDDFGTLYYVTHHDGTVSLHYDDGKIVSTNWTADQLGQSAATGPGNLWHITDQDGVNHPSDTAAAHGIALPDNYAPVPVDAQAVYGYSFDGPDQSSYAYYVLNKDDSVSIHYPSGVVAKAGWNGDQLKQAVESNPGLYWPVTDNDHLEKPASPTSEPTSNKFALRDGYAPAPDSTTAVYLAGHGPGQVYFVADADGTVNIHYKNGNVAPSSWSASKLAREAPKDPGFYTKIEPDSAPTTPQPTASSTSAFDSAAELKKVNDIPTTIGALKGVMPNSSVPQLRSYRNAGYALHDASYHEVGSPEWKKHTDRAINNLEVSGPEGAAKLAQVTDWRDKSLASASGTAPSATSSVDHLKLPDSYQQLEPGKYKSLYVTEDYAGNPMFAAVDHDGEVTFVDSEGGASVSSFTSESALQKNHDWTKVNTQAGLDRAVGEAASLPPSESVTPATPTVAPSAPDGPTQLPKNQIDMNGKQLVKGKKAIWHKGKGGMTKEEVTILGFENNGYNGVFTIGNDKKKHLVQNHKLTAIDEGAPEAVPQSGDGGFVPTAGAPQPSTPPLSLLKQQDPDPSHPLYNTPKPEIPEYPAPPAGTWVPDGWEAKVDAYYQARMTAKGSSAKPIKQSSTYSELRQIIDDGNTITLKKWLDRGRISQELYNEAKQDIDGHQIAVDLLKKQYQGKLDEYQHQLKEWRKANGFTGINLKGMKAPGAVEFGHHASDKSIDGWFHKNMKPGSLNSTGVLSPAAKSAVSAQKGSTIAMSLRTKLKEKSVNPAEIAKLGAHDVKNITGMDKAMQETPGLPQDMFVVRTMSGAETFINPKTGKKFESLTELSEMVGTVQHDWAYAETVPGSLDKGAGGTFGTGRPIIMQLRLPKGLKGVWTRDKDHGFGFKNEYGLILERGIAYYIHSVTKKNGKWVVDAEVIPKDVQYDQFDYFLGADPSLFSIG